jgi:hypothetical protein
MTHHSTENDVLTDDDLGVILASARPAVVRGYRLFFSAQDEPPLDEAATLPASLFHFLTGGVVFDATTVAFHSEDEATRALAAATVRYRVRRDGLVPAGG